MTREEWQELWTSYYALLAIATRVGFYSDTPKEDGAPALGVSPESTKG